MQTVERIVNINSELYGPKGTRADSKNNDQNSGNRLGNKNNFNDNETSADNFASVSTFIMQRQSGGDLCNSSN